MTLAAATRLGVYEITAPLGAGAMGEVYRARDTRIGREVAVKVLPGAHAENTDRLRRFEQEARAAGALNHPNVLTLHDVGLHDGTSYIVCELLEGETLRERMARGPLKLDKALDYAAQVARGLAAAHDKGIVHRDLKPENLFVTRDGRVKILDFGLAKLTERPAAAIDTSRAETAVRHTEAGLVMGTAGYMSPEQVRGQPADHRSDIFAFGAILHEMLTGERAFAAETSVQTMSAVLTADPPAVSARNPDVPPAIARIVRRCLEKAADNRFRSAHDLAFALETVAGPPGPGDGSATGRARRWAALAAALAIGAIGSAVVLRRPPPASPARPLWTSVLPPDHTTYQMTSQRLALSPDGMRIAFLARNRQGQSWLWVRELSEPTVRAIAETDAFATPFWSPDGKTLAFGAGGKLKTLELATGAVRVVCDAPRMRGGTWNRDGVMVLAPLTTGGLERVAASGGTPVALTHPDAARGEYSHRWPFFLPDGRHFLFLAQTRTDAGQGGDLYVGSLDGASPRLLLHDASNAEFVGSGHVVFARQGTLLVAPFDLGSRALTGEPAVVARDVAYMKPSELAAFSVASNGTLAYVAFRSGESRLQWLDRAGAAADDIQDSSGATLGEASLGAGVRLAPDGRSIAYIRLDSQMNGHLWVHDLGRGTSVRVTSDARFFQNFAWSPDGRRIASTSVQTGDIRETEAGGAGRERILRKTVARPMILFDWSRDGRLIVFTQLDPETGWDVWGLPYGTGQEPSPLLRTRFNETDVRLSPDGRWMAYVTDESGRSDVYVSSFPDAEGRRWPVSTAGGRRPTWRRDGRELYYISLDGKLMVVDVSPGPPPDFSSPRVLFDLPAPALDFERFTYDAAPDGRRFLLHLPHGREVPASITLVSGWTATLRR